MISTPLPHFWTSHTRQLSPKRNGKKPMVLPEESPTASRLTRKPPWEKPPRAAGDRPRCLSNLLKHWDGWKGVERNKEQIRKTSSTNNYMSNCRKQVAWKNVRINFEIDDSLSLCQTSPSFCPAAPCISATCGETVQSATRPFSVTWSDVDAVNVSFGASGGEKTRKIRNVESWKAIKTKCGDHKFSSCHQVFLWNTKNWYMLCLNIPNHVFVKAVWWLTVL